MKKIAFSILLGLAATNAALADFVQLPGHFGGYGSDATIKVAEDFQFAQTSSIGKLIWWGGYFNPPPGPDSFTLQLYADAAGRPGQLLSGFDIGPITKTATGNLLRPDRPDIPEYRYSADLLSPFVTQAGAAYWLSIIYSPDNIWLWECSQRTDINSGVQESAYGRPWQSAADTTAMQLVVVPASPPHFDGPVLFGSTLTLSGGGGTPNGNYILLASTNVALTVPNWDRVTTNQFDSGGNFSISMPVTSGVPQRYFQIQVP
jgi:hypothetical protein